MQTATMERRTSSSTTLALRGSDYASFFPTLTPVEMIDLAGEPAVPVKLNTGSWSNRSIPLLGDEKRPGTDTLSGSWLETDGLAIADWFASKPAIAVDRASRFRVLESVSPPASVPLIVPWPASESARALEPKMQPAVETVTPNAGAGLVRKQDVARVGALVTGAFATTGWLGTSLGGVVLVHPLICTVLLVASVVFFAMSRTHG